MNKNIIAVSIGDIDGIGIEILINLWKKNKINKFVLFTNKNIFENYLLINKIKLNINVVNEIYNKIECSNSSSCFECNGMGLYRVLMWASKNS